MKRTRHLSTIRGSVGGDSMYLNISNSKETSIANTSLVANSSIKKKTREEIKRLKSICFPPSQNHQTILEEPLRQPQTYVAAKSRQLRANTPDAHNSSFSMLHGNSFTGGNQTYFLTNPDVQNESMGFGGGNRTTTQKTQVFMGQTPGLSMFYESPVAEFTSPAIGVTSPMITQSYTIPDAQGEGIVPMTPKFEQASKLANSMLNFIMKITKKLNELCLTSQNSKALRASLERHIASILTLEHQWQACYYGANGQVSENPGLNQLLELLKDCFQDLLGGLGVLITKLERVGIEQEDLPKNRVFMDLLSEVAEEAYKVHTINCLQDIQRAVDKSFITVAVVKLAKALQFARMRRQQRGFVEIEKKAVMRKALSFRDAETRWKKSVLVNVLAVIGKRCAGEIGEDVRGCWRRLKEFGREHLQREKEKLCKFVENLQSSTNFARRDGSNVWETLVNVLGGVFANGEIEVLEIVRDSEEKEVLRVLYREALKRNGQIHVKGVAKWENSIVKSAELQGKVMTYKVQELGQTLIHSEVDMPMPWKKSGASGNIIVRVFPVMDEEQRPLGFVRFSMVEVKGSGDRSEWFAMERCVKFAGSVVRQWRIVQEVVGSLENRVANVEGNNQMLVKYNGGLAARNAEIALKVANAVVVGGESGENAVDVVWKELRNVIDFEQMMVLCADGTLSSYQVVYESGDGAMNLNGSLRDVMTALPTAMAMKNEKVIVGLIENMTASGVAWRFDTNANVFAFGMGSYFFILQKQRRDVREFQVQKLASPVLGGGGAMNSQKLRLNELNGRFLADFADVFSVLVNWLKTREEADVERMDTCVNVVRNPLRKNLADGVTLEGFAFKDNRVVYSVSVENGEFDVFQQVCKQNVGKLVMKKQLAQVIRRQVLRSMATAWQAVKDRAREVQSELELQEAKRRMNDTEGIIIDSKKKCLAASLIFNTVSSVLWDVEGKRSVMSVLMLNAQMRKGVEKSFAKAMKINKRHTISRYTAASYLLQKLMGKLKNQVVRQVLKMLVAFAYNREGIAGGAAHNFALNSTFPSMIGGSLQDASMVAGGGHWLNTGQKMQANHGMQHVLRDVSPNMPGQMQHVGGSYVVLGNEQWNNNSFSHNNSYLQVNTEGDEVSGGMMIIGAHGSNENDSSVIYKSHRQGAKRLYSNGTTFFSAKPKKFSGNAGGFVVDSVNNSLQNVHAGHLAGAAAAFVGNAPSSPLSQSIIDTSAIQSQGPLLSGRTAATQQQILQTIAGSGRRSNSQNTRVGYKLSDKTIHVINKYYHGNGGVDTSMSQNNRSYMSSSRGVGNGHNVTIPDYLPKKG